MAKTKQQKRAKPAAAPPAEPPAAESVAQRMLRVYAMQLTAKMKANKPLSPAEVRLLERASAEATDRAWPDRDACCREMTAYYKRQIHSRTIYEWSRHGAPFPRSGPIDKLPIWRWLAAEKREKGRPGTGNVDPEMSDRLIQERIRNFVLKNETLAGSKIGIDEAASIIDTASEDLKSALRHDLPNKAAEVAREAASLEAAAILVRGLIDEALGAFAAAADQLHARAEKLKQTATA